MAHIAGNIFTGRCWMTCRQIANSCTVHSSIGFGADTLNCISLMCTIQEIDNLVFQIGWSTVHFIAATWFLLYFMLNCSFAQLFLGAFEWKAETENVSIQHADSFCLFTESPEIFCESPEICRISKALFSLQGLAGQDLKTLSNIPSFKKCFNSFLWSSCHSCWCDVMIMMMTTMPMMTPMMDMCNRDGGGSHTSPNRIPIA